MKILLTGKDDFTYNRTRVLLAGLRQMPNVELIYFPIGKRKNFDHKKFTQISSECDLIYLPPFRHHDVKFIKKFAACPVIFDALISKYLTRTIDHGKWWTAMEKTYKDKIAFRNSDYILMDTQVHKNYIVDRYKLQPDRVLVLPVGVDTDHFKPSLTISQKSQFTVGFYGGFIPLQGVDKIVKAADLLKGHSDIRFELIGKGPMYRKVRAMAKELQTTNIDFLGWAAYETLNDKINSFDVCLGIFGDSLKADLVVPNKLYHYAALGKCVITKDTVGIREVFDNTNAILINNEPEKIAEAIRELKSNSEIRASIAQKGSQLIRKNYNHKKIAELFLKQIALSFA